MSVLADTSGIYAVLDRTDRQHEVATRIWALLLSGSERVLITNYILIETMALVQRRLGMEAVRALVDEMLPALEVEWVSREDQHAALAAVLAANRRNLSLVDCTSFQVLRRLGQRTVFAFDPHFEEHGFEPVVPG